MLTQERRDIITNIINERKAVTVAELVDELDTSAATIRRDLTELARMHKIQKVFGGATSISDITTHEDAVNEKLQKNVQAKDKISRYAASLIQDGDFVYIDSGTTTLKLIDYIENRNARYITNGIVHAKKLIERHLPTMIIGGRVKESTEAIVGPDCVEYIRRYHFTKAFMGTNGISTSAGFTTPDVDEAMVKSEAIRHTYMTYILADSSKFDKVSSVTFAELPSCCIITNKEPEKKFINETVIKYF
ncbi:DeoR/GlpR family DNA-binding transcription regulator [Butyrivibrio sp. NC3005]|uniref:DeoR/GlpR family DNA-binding transcription regulator n=1 Tax=Butyrivibrio sp. NC3005 TaxID=1280685 RepID=UPI00040BB069|nr:DeoR/GlpR family DNA-binding transcription regulator [Butyrivibrio sp. NC3005]